MRSDLEFYKGKRVFITGHTGFKGTWLCQILTATGAEVTGYSLAPTTEPSLFELTDMQSKVRSVLGDIRDRSALQKTFDSAEPEIVFHLAAQPLVRESYRIPAYTYETNVMGTVNVLECIRNSNTVRSFLNVTTDKVYADSLHAGGHRETDALDGFDPYANSKSCSELVTHSYQRSFFADRGVAVSTARSGNVIGGGDFAKDRIIPDCVRAALNGNDVVVRHPESIRPYQHVLEPLFVYLLIAAKQYEDSSLQGCYNVGPDEKDCCSTGALVDLFIRHWGAGIKRIDRPEGGVYETERLQLNCDKLQTVFQWHTVWNLDTAVKNVVEWTRCLLKGGDISACMDRQIEDFLRCWREI